MPLHADFSEKVVKKCPTVLPLQAKYSPPAKQQEEIIFDTKNAFDLRVTERHSSYLT